MNKEEIRKELLRREAKRELARRNLIDFLSYDGNGNFQTPIHVRFIADKVQKALEGKIKRLIISVPPRHSKSEISTKKAPAWYKGKHPENDVILSSYSQEMINDFSRIARNTFKEHQKLFDLELAKDKSSVNEWGAQGFRGMVKAAGIGGGLTGKGAKVAIIDDCLKDWEEAQSKRQRDLIWNWYKSVLRTRLAPNASIIVIMTRWHTDDLAGRLLEDAKNGGEQWEEIKLKAIADENDPLGRQPGEALWPEWFPIEELRIIERTLGPMMFNALYQQSPTNNESGMFKSRNFRYWEEDGNFLKLYHNGSIIKTWLKAECIKRVTVDTALKKNELNDFTSLNGFWETPDKDILFDEITEERLEVPDQYSTLLNFVDRHNPREVGIEDKQSGTGLIQQGKRDGLQIKELSADTDKVVRASTLSVYYDNGKVYHKRNAYWVTKFEEQLTSFPFASHDDMVDTASNAAIMVRDAVSGQNNNYAMLKNLIIRKR